MYETCLFFNLNSFTRLLNKRWEEEFEKFGLSAAHGYLLRLVLEKPDSTQKFLAEELGLAPSTVTRFLETLEEKGFVKRTCCSFDARVTKVNATGKGNAIHAQLTEASSRLGDLLKETLGAQEAEALVDQLRKSQQRLTEKLNT